MKKYALIHQVFVKQMRQILIILWKIRQKGKIMK